MKTMSAREAKNSFGAFLDSAQREPVVVTKRDRPVGVMFSMHDVPGIMEFADLMRSKINSGIENGLADAEAGRGHELNDDYVKILKLKLQERLNNKKNV